MLFVCVKIVSLSRGITWKIDGSCSAPDLHVSWLPSDAHTHTHTHKHTHTLSHTHTHTHTHTHSHTHIWEFCRDPCGCDEHVIRTCIKSEVALCLFRTEKVRSEETPSPPSLSSSWLNGARTMKTCLLLALVAISVTFGNGTLTTNSISNYTIVHYFIVNLIEKLSIFFLLIQLTTGHPRKCASSSLLYSVNCVSVPFSCEYNFHNWF